ncbi:TonB-dependent receptor [Klebsiella pneumoniae]|nr:TonB-dependent receptor [Klebsiella pneumoniae]UPZ02465.1 TonB-dependent receptor [Klebsiella pneumoniae]
MQRRHSDATRSKLLGGRLDWYEYTSKGTSINTGYKVTRNITKYAGSTYNLDDHHTIYGSYTDIFNPQSSTDLNGKVIKPIVGKNYETGIKGEYFNGLLNASLAVAVNKFFPGNSVNSFFVYKPSSSNSWCWV